MSDPLGPAPTEVPAPQTRPYRYGLLSAADVLPDEPRSARWQLTGVTYGSICGPGADVWFDRCVWPPTAPQQVVAVRVTFAKPIGQDALTATLTSRHPGYQGRPVTVTIGGTSRTLAAVGDTESVPVAASSTVAVSVAITGLGVMPSCTTGDDVDVPATAGTTTQVLECSVTPTGEVKHFTEGLAQVIGRPYTVYAGASCLLHSGRTDVELGLVAEQRLAAYEQVQVERRFQVTELTGAGVTVLPPPSGTAWNLCRAVGELEQLVALHSGGMGVLHAPRAVATPATAKAVAKPGTFAPGVAGVVRQLVTPLDNLWAFGAGYTNTSPAGVDAPPGQAWLYATGAVVVRRTVVTTAQAVAYERNARLVLSERSYVVTADCPAFAALVQIPEC